MRTLILFLVLTSLVVGVTASAGAAEAQAEKVRVLRVPNGGIHPQAEVDQKGVLHLIYFKGKPAEGDIFYVHSTDVGATFSEPKQVNSQASSVIIAGTVRGPQLAIGKDGRVHIAWMGSKNAQPRLAEKLAPMLYTRLNDAGDAFEPERNVIQKHPGLDGGGSIAADSSGNVFVSWHAPQDINNKADPEGDRTVWVTKSADDGTTFGEEIMASPQPRGACACCGMRIFVDAKGNPFISYRIATKKTDRATHVLASKDGGKTFSVVLEDPWNIGACVMSTPTFAQGPAAVSVAWETEKQIVFAKIDAKSLKATEPLPMPGTGKNRKHPRLAVSSTGVTLVAWTDDTSWNKGGTLAWQLLDADGKPVKEQAGRKDGLPAWGVPAVVALADERFVIIY